MDGHLNESGRSPWPKVGGPKSSKVDGRAKLDGLGSNWTVFCAKVVPDDSGPFFEPSDHRDLKWTIICIQLNGL